MPKRRFNASNERDEMINILNIIGRQSALFTEDLNNLNEELTDKIASSAILVVGGAGSIGKEVVKEIFKRGAKTLHVVDLSENNLVELVREIRSAYGYVTDDFKIYCLDVGSLEFDAFMENSCDYDYIFNLSALKHVRSEENAFTLMRMIQTNIFNSIKLHNLVKSSGKYFCVSSDKAANPANLMGATKRIMELFAFGNSSKVSVSMARFANVAFSDGSLLHGFENRIRNLHPITAPNDIRRYFITPSEAGELCILSGFFANSGEIYFPLNGEKLPAITFDEVATRYLNSLDLKPHVCESEDEARNYFSTASGDKHWPCYFFKSDTTGEKPLEEFFTQQEEVDMMRYKDIGVVVPASRVSVKLLSEFTRNINNLYSRGSWSKIELSDLIQSLVPEMNYSDKHKFLNGRM